MPNRLAQATSPYLLQHANNPVDWFPWSEEAFALARREDKPVFLSIGYSACHWCHVMERESFENEEVAKIMNENFVSIKVDREERPDIDDIYMTATQLLSGHGGWPNSVFLTPDRKPYYAGTYFPPDDRYGRSGFKSVLLQLSKAFRERRGEIEKQGIEIVHAMKTSASGTSMAVKSVAPLSRGIVADAIKELRFSYDEDHGGFGNAPKFPPHTSLELLLNEQARLESSMEMAKGTLDGMARGGIHDHVGGGFARYSTDEEWLVPHFEKMLYDNAQLSRIYVKAFLKTGEEKYRRVADGVFGWVLREMTDKDGAFYSALDADSEGEEGKFYLWTKQEILDLLGSEEGEDFCRAYNVAEKGNFIDPHMGHYDGRNILHLTDDLARPMNNSLEVLLESRSRRIRPGLDDKILVSWNGLMIESLAFAGRELGDPRYTAAARKAADYILREMKIGPRLMATARQGKAQLNGYLDDYVFLSAGLLELGKSREAAELMDFVLEKFSDSRPDGSGGGFYFTSDDHEELLYRWKDPFDKAIPSGNGKAVQVFLNLYRATREEKYLHAAKHTLEAFSDMMERASRAMHSFILGLAIYLDDYDAAAALLTAEPSVKVKAAPEKQLGDALIVRFDLTVRKNYTLSALSLKIEHESTAMIETVDYPSGTLAGDLTIRAKIRLMTPRMHDHHPIIRFQLSYQACDDRFCHTPESVAIPLEIMFANDNISR